MKKRWGLFVSPGRSLACLLVLFAALFLVACGKNPPEPLQDLRGLSGKVSPQAEMLFARAHVLWKGTETASDPERAEALLSESLAIEPDYHDALLWRGLARSQLDDWDGSIDDLTRAVRLNPTAQAYAWRGLAFFRTGNYLGARRDLDRSISLDASQHRAWNFRAAVSLAEGKQDAACADFGRGCRNGDCTGLENARNAEICPR